MEHDFIEVNNHQSTKVKIALLGDWQWALGSINYHLQKYLSPYYHTDVFHWQDTNQVQQAVGGEYSIVIGEAHIKDLKKLGYTIGKGVTFMPMFHHDVKLLANLPFDTPIPQDDFNSYSFYSISEDISTKVKERYGVETGVLPIGVCSKFWGKRSITSINTLGFVGRNNPSHDRVKRLSMFKNIAESVGLPHNHLFGKHFSEGAKIYENVNMVICTSIGEGNPMSFLECAACKIPFISTKVGIVPEYNSVKTFDTVEEAVKIIRHLNSSPLILQQYVNDVYNEVMADREWSKIVEKYWIPTINNILQK